MKGPYVSQLDPTESALSTFRVGDEEQLVQQLASLESHPLSERVRVLHAVHAQLTQTLSALDHV